MGALVCVLLWELCANGCVLSHDSVNWLNLVSISLPFEIILKEIHKTLQLKSYFLMVLVFVFGIMMI